MRNLFINAFGGIRRTNSICDLGSSGKVSAVDCQNVDLRYTGNAGNVALFTTKGNKEVVDVEKKVVGQFESVQNGVSYWFIYAVDDQRGYLYSYNVTNSSLSLLDVSLSVSNSCNGITIAQGFDDWFVFTNGKDDYVGICMQKTLLHERIVNLNAVDAEGRDIRGLALEVHDGRLVAACENRVHWSAQNNIFDWNSDDAELVTIPAYQEFDREVTALAYYDNALIVFTKDYSVAFRGNPSDVSSFVRTGAAGGGCPSFKSVLKFDNKLFYYDHAARNVFAYYILDTGQSRPTNGCADDMLEYFNKISSRRIKEIEVISHINGDRSEIWFKIPSDEENLILVYDYLKREWVVRKAQKDIHALAVIHDALYSASGNKILKENLGSDFNGEFVPSEYIMPVINLGSDSNIKVPKMPLIMTLDWEYDNDFYMEFIYDDQPEKKKIKHIVKHVDGYLIWSKDQEDPDGGQWALDADDADGGIWVSSEKNTIMFNLDGLLHFKQLQIRIFTTHKPQEFSIKRLEFKRVGMKTKSLG